MLPIDVRLLALMFGFAAMACGGPTHVRSINGVRRVLVRFQVDQTPAGCAAACSSALRPTEHVTSCYPAVALDERVEEIAGARQHLICRLDR